MRQRSNMAAGRGPIKVSGGSSLARGYNNNNPGGNGNGGNNGGGDTYVETVGYERNPTAGDKIGNSLKGLLFGPVVIFIGCTLLWYNEEWAIKTHRSLNEALEAYVAIDDPNDKLAKEEYAGRLVHLTHMVSVEGPPVTDPTFDLARQNVVALNRQVEIYQWVESIKQEKIKKGDHKEIREIVNYKKKWVNNPIDSSNFRHLNGHENCCGSLPVESETFRAETVKMGPYSLGVTLTKQLSKTTSAPTHEVKKLPPGAQTSPSAIYLPRGGGSIQSAAAAALPSGGGDDVDLSQAIEEKTFRIDGEEKAMYIVKATGDSYSSKEKAIAAAKELVPAAAQESRMTQQQRAMNAQDEIGDVKITFSETRCALVSVLAKLSESGTVLTKWQSKQGGGYDVAQLSYGDVSAREMIDSAQSANTAKTWIFRFGGWVLNFIGFSMITSIVSTTADITLNWIPFLGPMANSLINLGVTVANFILAFCTTLLVASIAWVFYRPLLGISLLAGSIGLFFTTSRAGKARGNLKPDLVADRKSL